MDFGYDIGDRVIQIQEKVIGKVIDMYYPTTCKQQTMILCDDGRKYHAPSETFFKVSELEERIVSKIKSRPQPLAMSASAPLAQEMAQPMLVPHDYRNVKVADGMTITIDLEDLKRKLADRICEEIGLNYGA